MRTCKIPVLTAALNAELCTFCTNVLTVCNTHNMLTAIGSSVARTLEASVHRHRSLNPNSNTAGPSPD
jgi:hypothetical protein